MRIISHWRDYYDGARAWGSDPSVVYVRERREHSWPDVRRAGDVDAALWSLRGMLAAVPSNPDFLAHGAVAFCGAVHPVWKVLESGKYRSSGMLWTLDQVEGALFGRHGSDGRALIDRLVDHPWGSWRWLSSNTYRSFMEHPPVIADEIHRLLRAPILLLDHVHGVVANPSLKGTGFEAVVPPNQAWQRIAQFMGNNMIGSPEPGFTGGDDVRRDAHGFDERSFRRHTSEGRKARRGRT